MDSVTQIALGAAVGEAILGRRLGNRAPLWGAVFGTLPDLDVVIAPFVDSVGFIVHHRAMSHSLIVVAVASPLLAGLFRRLQGLERRSRSTEPDVTCRRWLVFFLGILVTHILLDCLTSYGTQILWPLSDRRVSWSSIFIVDPLYTAPLLAGVVGCLLVARGRRLRQALNVAGLVISTAYLGWTAVNKAHMDALFAEIASSRGLVATRVMTCPTPFNNILWYGIVETEAGFHVGYASLLDETRDESLRFVPRREELLAGLRDDWRVDRLVWFADGYYAVEPHPDGLLFHVLKFGRLDLEGDEALYPFSYVIRRTADPGVQVEPLPRPQDVELPRRLGELWRRLLGRPDRRRGDVGLDAGSDAPPSAWGSSCTRVMARG